MTRSGTNTTKTKIKQLKEAMSQDEDFLRPAHRVQAGPTPEWPFFHPPRRRRRAPAVAGIQAQHRRGLLLESGIIAGHIVAPPDAVAVRLWPRPARHAGDRSFSAAASLRLLQGVEPSVGLRGSVQSRMRAWSFPVPAGSCGPRAGSKAPRSARLGSGRATASPYGGGNARAGSSRVEYSPRANPRMMAARRTSSARTLRLRLSRFKVCLSGGLKMMRSDIQAARATRMAPTASRSPRARRLPFARAAALARAPG